MAACLADIVASPRAMGQAIPQRDREPTFLACVQLLLRASKTASSRAVLHGMGG
jgi:hypothetical protein